MNHLAEYSMIYESIICTNNADGIAHLTPLGYRYETDQVILSPYVPSNTLSNLRITREATLNFTDDVRVYAGCLTGRRDWPLTAAATVETRRLQNCLSHLEVKVVDVLEDELRPQFKCRIVNQDTHAAFRGFNRAQSAVVEACILATRLDWLEVEKIRSEMAYLQIAITKTAGDQERCAWQWIVEKIDSHPRHKGFEASLKEHCL
ncbi:MAG: DUF447 domain-containing protein [Gammaproteobacteria bacterium]